MMYIVSCYYFLYFVRVYSEEKEIIFIFPPLEYKIKKKYKKRKFPPGKKILLYNFFFLFGCIYIKKMVC